MSNSTQFYINGQWVDPITPNPMEVINPANEQAFATISSGTAADVDRAVAAAEAAFPAWGQSSKEERLALLDKLDAIYERRKDEMAKAISTEMGAPIDLATRAQTGVGQAHIKYFRKTLEAFEFEYHLNGDTRADMIIHEPIGVCGLITPWNWPLNQIALKVIAALAAGNCCVLKPSEVSPMSALLFAEMIDEAGFPAGTFNLVNGTGPEVGDAMSRHPKIDMMSFTGSAAAGIAVTKSSADTVKRVVLELGGKGANIVFADSDIEKSVKRGAIQMFNNTGQSCNAPSRMLVERSVYEDAVQVAAEAARSTTVGDPAESGRHIGPLVSAQQFERVQDMIQSGIDEGARLVEGGVGRPEGFNRGYFARPTVFADVTHDMRIGREEIFGPVLSMMPFDDEAHAIEIANDTTYGLTNYVQTSDMEKAQRIARAMRAGMVSINGSFRAMDSPFGGMRQSGNGREGGKWGLEEFLEVKAISGWS
ncbi:MAG: aldehyde dehydrogenase family protein [Alphaproteobacteria bacterium]|nr:aldehyde dehydrogenase family protein [Alphaproteobacteria bacterium SS10]